MCCLLPHPWGFIRSNLTFAYFSIGLVKNHQLVVLKSFLTFGGPKLRTKIRSSLLGLRRGLGENMFFWKEEEGGHWANDLISRSTSACCKVNCWVLPLQWRIWAGFWGFPIEFQELLWFFVCCSSYVVTFNVMEVTQRLFGMHMLFVVEGTWAPNMHLSKLDMANVAVLFGILIFSQSHWKAFILQYFFCVRTYMEHVFQCSPLHLSFSRG